MRRLSLVAPALIVSWGILFSVLIALTDLPQAFLGLLCVYSCLQLYLASRNALAIFALGVIVGLVSTSIRVRLPEKDTLIHAQAEVLVLSKNESSRGISYKVQVTNCTSDEGLRYYGFPAYMPIKKNTALELDKRYLLSCTLIRDDFSVRIKTYTIRNQRSPAIPINGLREQLRQACLMRSAEMYAPSNERSFIETVTFGGKLQPILRSRLNRFGLDHIAAVSGFHFGLVAGFAWWISLIFLRGAVARLLVLSALIAYGFIVGPQPSVLRAFIAASFFVLGPLFSRRTNGLNNLGVGLGALLLYEPLFVFSMGFQLSFAATLGILLLYKPLSQVLLVGRGYWGDLLVAGLCVSCSALVMALPIQIVQTGSFSLLGPIYNLIVPLLVGWIMLMYLSSLLLPKLIGVVFAWGTSSMLSLLMDFLTYAPEYPHGLYQISCSVLVGSVICFLFFQCAILVWQRSKEENVSILDRFLGC